jgi:hypothetical protein
MFIVFGGTEVLSAARMHARIGGLPAFYPGSPSARFDRMERRDARLVEHCFKVGLFGGQGPLGIPTWPGGMLSKTNL